MNHWKSLFYASILGDKLEAHIGQFSSLINDWEADTNDKNKRRWEQQLKKLPSHNNQAEIDISDAVSLYSKRPLEEKEQLKTRAVLQQFMPWRKGPFDFFGIEINTEWRSDFKWNRLLPHIDSLKNKKVLDVGCGSGYHLWRMFDEGAEYCLGIDPTDLFFYQFQCFKQYLEKKPVHFLPIGIENMPSTHAFDTVFSMGVLYHRPDPLNFLKELKAQLCSGGQLVLETLVIDGDKQSCLVPEDRYAQMRNVWFIPSVNMLCLWLYKLGFVNVRCVDLDVTSLEEQRRTEWMQNHSLIDFLDPDDNSKTIEGYPAPKRAVVLANRK